jgi:hypothetical protein
MAHRTKNGTAGEWQELKKQIDAAEKEINPIEEKLYMLECALEDHLQTAIIGVINDEHETADVSNADTWLGYELALERAGKIVTWARGYATMSDALHKHQMQLINQRDELAAPAEVRAKWAALRSEYARANAKWHKTREPAEKAARS